MAEVPSISPIERQILQFFIEHSNAVETVRGMSTWLGTEPQAIESALNSLVEKKWLSSHAAGALTGYTLTSEERFVNQIKQTLELP